MAKTPNKLDDKEILEKLAQDFHELVTNEDALHSATKHFLKNTIDELSLGVIFDLHRKFKTGAYDIVGEEEEPDDDEAPEIPGGDIFGQHDSKKTINCTCPNCGRAVAATVLAPHLEKCMGISRARNVTRRVASGGNNNNNSSSKDREVATFSGVPSDDEDDMDWNGGNKRGNKKKKKNGNKKSKVGNPKSKLGDPSKCGDFLGADGDQDEDNDLSNLRDLLQDHSNSSSPADSASSTQSTASSKEKEKAKKKNRRDRSSPSSSISAD